MNYKIIMRTLGILFLSVLATQSVEAARLTPQQALSRVQQSSSLRLRMPGNASYELTYTGQSAGTPALYVFNKGTKGFIITSADDRMPALLGYSDNGSFDLNNASPELKWWLSQYVDEAAYFFKNESKFTSYSSSVSRQSDRANIEPLVKTKWNQYTPYNNDCPVIGDNRSLTGCVATAMAQVINYHKYPVTGTGSNSYESNGATYSFDYGSTTFDWANMLDEYGDNATSAQNAAVAQLMYACGVGVNMIYGVSGSAALDTYVPYALKKYFNYDEGVRFLERQYYSDADWENMIYDELAAKRPIIYSGQANEGGHSFVCDGYEDGYFHINWGWGGYCDGNFLLSALNPEGQGAGGFEGGYNSDQSVILGIQRPVAGSTPWYPIYATNGLKIIGSEGIALYLSIDSNGGVLNYSPETLTVEFYLKAISENGAEFVSKQGVEYTFEFMSGTGIITVVAPSNMPAGKYKAYLMFKTPSGNMQPVLIPQGCADYVEITVDADGNISYGNGEPEEKAQIKVTTFTPNGKVISGVEASFNFSAENIGEILYNGDIYICTYKKGTDVELVKNPISLTFGPGQTISGIIYSTYSLEPGEYEVIFYDKYGDKISEAFPLTIVSDAQIDATGITIDKTEASLFEGETVTLKATITPETATDKAVTWSSSNGEIATVDGTGVVTAVKAGTATITATTSNGLKAECVVTVKAKVIDATGITLDKTEASLVEGETVTLKATIAPETATDKTVTWSSSDAEIATVDAAGLVTAVKAGTATITATTSNGLKAECVVTVKAKVIDATGITLDKTEASLVEGETVALTATIVPETTTDKTLTWSSSDSEVATVDAAGVVTAVKAGTATITATTSNGLKAECVVTVKAKVIDAIGITLDKTEASLVEGESVTLKATIAPEDATDKAVTWSSSNDEIATVDATGVVTAVKAGTATITATTGNGLKAECVVTVNAKVIEAADIMLDKIEATLVEGETLTLTATIDPETTTDKTVTWSSADSEVATVDAAGVVTAVKAGIATISATTSNGLTAKCVVTVEPAIILVSSITLDQENIAADPGTVVKLTATINPDNATDKTLVWTSSDENIATVDEEGVVTVINVGAAVITATAADGSDVSATCQVSGLSGIESLMVKEGNADVYTLSGLLLKKNADREFLSTLAKGVYILNISGKVHKVVLR